MIALCALCITSCKKEDEPLATPAVVFNFVKYWGIDTLRNGLLSTPTDSLIAFKHGDTSGFYYHGTTLYVFSETFDTTSGAITCYYSPVCFDTSAKWSKGSAFPYKYWHIGDGVHKTQRQAATIVTRSPHFSTSGDAWYYGKKI